VNHKKQFVGITGQGFRPKQWWTTLVHCVKDKEALKQCHELLPTALHLDRSLVCLLLHYVAGLGRLILWFWLIFFGVLSMFIHLYWVRLYRIRIRLICLCELWLVIQYWQLVGMFKIHA
jgi:hypothetical protein